MRTKIKAIALSAICVYIAINCLMAEPRTWTSISGSTIEALFLGEFGEDYWFEASEDGKFIKMPSKYISEADVKLVNSGEATGTLPASICDKDPASIQLLESIYTTAAAELPPEAETLQHAIEQLLLQFQPKDEEEAEEIEISFTKRKYKKAAVADSPDGGSVYELLMQLLNPHELNFQIREGGLKIGKF